MSSSQGPHDWLIHVLDDLALYATEHDLPRIAHGLEQARQALDLSSRKGSQAAIRTVERAWFVDTLRDLIDYAAQNGLTETERHLIQSLERAPQEWENTDRAADGQRAPAAGDAARDGDGTYG
jgi:hypothetical protein